MANKTVASDAEFKTYVEGLPSYASGTVYMNDDSKYWTFTKQATDKINSMCVAGDDVELWIFDGTDWIIRTNKKIHVTTPSISSLPITLYCPEVTSNMIISRVVVNTPSAQTNTWNFSSADGSFTITGNISGSTTLDLDLYEPDHVCTATTTAS